MDHRFLHDPRRVLIVRLVAAQAYPPYKTSLVTTLLCGIAYGRLRNFTDMPFAPDGLCVIMMNPPVTPP